MSRELDALDFIQDEPRYSNDIKYRDSIDLIRSALIEKEDLDNVDPSEALTEIFNIIYNLDCGTTYEQDKKLDVCRKTIEKALFKGQENENELDNLKSKRMLNIIKEKKIIDIKWLKGSRNYKEYNAKIFDVYKDFDSLLTEDEFDLLKEMFA